MTSDPTIVRFLPEELSVFIIKPEAFQHREEICHIIAGKLTILRRSTAMVDKMSVRALYGKSTSPIMLEVILAAYSQGPSEVGVVGGPNAIQQLVKLAGYATDPRICNVDTIRYRYGLPDPQIIRGQQYFANGFHRPKTREEAVTDIETILSLSAR